MIQNYLGRRDDDWFDFSCTNSIRVRRLFRVKAYNQNKM